MYPSGKRTLITSYIHTRHYMSMIILPQTREKEDGTYSLHLLDHGERSSLFIFNLLVGGEPPPDGCLLEVVLDDLCLVDANLVGRFGHVDYRRPLATYSC